MNGKTKLRLAQWGAIGLVVIALCTLPWSQYCVAWVGILALMIASYLDGYFEAMEKSLRWDREDGWREDRRASKQTRG